MSDENESDDRESVVDESGGRGNDASGVPVASDRNTEIHDRAAQAVADEEPPRLPFIVVGVGGSAGGLEAFTEFLEALPPRTGMAFVIVQHLSPDHESLIADILSRHNSMPVVEIDDGMAVEPNHVYVIRPGHTLTIKDGILRLGVSLARPGHNRPVDDFFKSLAEEQRQRSICILMSGMGSNGTAGAQAIKAVGGLVLAQDPESSLFPSMPQHVINAGYADFILKPSDMPGVLQEYALHPYTRDDAINAQSLLQREQRHFREIMAILRTRTRQDFSGYKKPTVLRRIQRRMGLQRLSQIGEYAKLLRQSPTEVTALADDLLIHVTGFFRDPEAWETLRQKVIVPLVANREADSLVRCWVSACSSGEEAYTLAILLVEESERVNKPLDIKIFATDTALRTLQNARHGLYPGGIEAEISPERLTRFFIREDAVYRVRPDLRERVVFAPQNILQDPPFSRLDIVSCRNLLIYLEPEVQQRVMTMLHFGLREGGTLFLGSSETAGGQDELFQVVDKKARIYRRVGMTRHGTVDFPAPRAIAPISEMRLRGEGKFSIRSSMAQMTHRALLERHTPAAVTVDRERRIVYFHGDTAPFLDQPRGEATRDLMILARDTLRGAVRVALNSAASESEKETVGVSTGWVSKGDSQVRVMVTASPLDLRSAPEFFVVSFEELETIDTAPTERKGNGDAHLDEELVRVRHELQSTIEELQTSNEELKASNEEVMSVNEELQSANEELETSKEEMQSLNEELTTVNAQLQTKMDELQATSSDLSSVLASTDIGVIFLDTAMRIRRYTPAVRELLELIHTDTGRPISDLAWKFTDPQLLEDVEWVLTKLVPREKEIVAEGGKWFVRRVLPYRTIDNRIDGVVITFINISERRRDEDERKLLSAIVEAANDAIVSFTLDGRIVTWNRAAEKLFGFSRDEALKMNIAALYPADQQDAPEDLLNRLKDGVPVLQLETVQLARGNSTIHVSVTASLAKGTGKQPTASAIIRDITERKNIEANLRDAKIAAEQASRMKDDFLATLSHELRTPLSAILLWTEMLSKPPTDNEQLSEGLEAIRKSAEAQKMLIEDLLDTSRIVSGKMRLRLQQTHLASVVEEAVHAIVPTAALKQITVRKDIGKDVDYVTADPDRLRQIVWNLLTNAVKFTPPGGIIDVGLWRRGDEVEIRVADNGKGIEPEFLAKVFDRFRQAESSTTRNHAGLGLGLSIARQLVELHSGTIEAASEGSGKGAVFTVKLPLRKNSQIVTEPANATAEHPPRPSTQGLEDLHILLVEDEADTRNALARLLKNAGALVTAADTAESAYAQIVHTRPDLIVSDLGLPGEDGYSLIRRIRAYEEKNGIAHAPAIALTAFARDQDRTAALESGFQQHVSKPIDPQHLIFVLRKLVGRTGDASSPAT